MLENKRFNFVLDICSKLKGENIQTTKVRQEMLEEHFQTQIILERQGVNSDSPPSALKNINQILFPSRYVRRKRGDLPLHIEILGCPEIGKTTSINLIPFIFGNDVVVTEKKIDFVKKSHSEDIGSSDVDIEITKFLLNVVEPLVRVRRRANLKENYKIALIDRGIVDQQIFLRAHFLVGNLNARVDIGSNHSPVEMIRQVTNSQKYDYYFGVIMCLAKPDVSLQRSKRKEFGHIVNPTFLNLLYEQYLRANYELTHSLLPIPYACLDFSADDPLGNTTLLTNTVESMASYFDINLRAQEGTQ